MMPGMMMEDTALATMQRSLSEAREAKRKIQSRLQEIDTEAATLRSQLSSFEIIIEQTEGAIRRMLFPNDQSGERPLPPGPSGMPTPPPMPMTPDQNPFAQRMNAHFDSAAMFQNANYQPAHYQQNPYPANGYANGFHPTEVPTSDIDAAIAAAKNSEKDGNVRFNDFRIPQAATIVLREAIGALHVSEIYRRMAQGGFEFRGQHQLITLAVSLSRSKRFRKIAPGTFELNPAYQTGQVA